MNKMPLPSLIWKTQQKQVVTAHKVPIKAQKVHG